MKRKIFSKLLMGALLCTSVSAFVSCKDYDDDINANKADIKAAQEQLTTLSSNLTSLQQKLDQEKTALQQELAQAKSQLETQIANAKADLNTAIAAKADQSTVDALATRVGNLETDLAATKEAYNAKIEAINNSLATLQGLLEKKADQTYVEQAIATLNAAISGKVSTEDFNTFKADVAKIETNLSNLTTLVGTKADQTAVDKAVDAINKDIAQLQKDLTNGLAQQKKDFDAAVAQLDGKIALKADQSALDALNITVAALSGAVQELVTSVSTKADKATVTALETKVDNSVKALNEQISKLVTTEQLNTAIDNVTKAMALMESNINGKIDQKANQAEFALVKEDLANLRGAFERHNENIALAISDAINTLEKKLMPIIDSKVAQSDYDETVKELNEAQDSIASILTTLAAVDGDIDAIYGLIADLTSETADSVSALRASITKSVNNATIAIRALQLQGNALAGFIGEFEEGATLASTLSELQSKMSQEVKDSIKNQNAARTAAIAKIGEEIADLRSELQDTIDSNAASIKDLQEKFSKISDIIDQRIAENINNLTVFVSKSLKSISLVPQLFVGGIEAIEFKSLQYTEVKPGTSGETAKSGASATLIDNGTAEAYYRLNPSIVDRASIDEENIEFLAATAATRAATVTSPVAFNGISDWNYGGKKGLVKVNLKKTITTSLNNAGNGNIYIVALKVPRKATKISGVDVEAADIVSENSRLVETTIRPRIARLPWNLTETLRDNSGNASNVHHYSDSATIWNSNVDATPLEMVYQEVNYNQTFDVLQHVTGCNVTNPHTQITKAQLKSYGLTFRFAIPSKEYKKDADHSTDQQQFATIDSKTGIVSSKLPNGVVDNRACVGKEPIIRIMLVDTVRNKLVDERYMKIKWVEQLKPDVTLADYHSDSPLEPCNDDGQSVSILWRHFINEVYAKADGNGLSQSVFEAVYPVANVEYSAVTQDFASRNLIDNFDTPNKPVVRMTTNENGDAVIATWTLTPAMIANIYPHQTKTFTATIKFISSIPQEYPNLIQKWTWTISLPTLPEINGYYDNYWFTQYSLHDVMPVQYGTKLYKQIADGNVVPQGGNLETYNRSNNMVAPGTDYAVYYNNLMNAFTYEQVNGNPRFIVKNLGNCSTWDMQFTKAGNDAIAGAAIPAWDTQHSNVVLPYTQFNGYAPKFGTNRSTWSSSLSPLLTRDPYATFEGYRLYRDPWGSNEKQALQMVWDEDHVSWCGNPAHYQANLYADHNNPANQALINELQSAPNLPVGIAPGRTHDKKVHIGVWGTLNNWNIIPVHNYDICLVAPLAINATLGGAFEEGYVSGTAVSCDDAFSMVDFRGYLVKNATPAANATEFYKYADKLYKYYEVGNVEWNLTGVKYGMAWRNNSLVKDDSGRLTATQISNYTNGNIVLSVTKETGSDGKEYLVFRNNGGSNVEEEIKIFIPVSVKYGFGVAEATAEVTLYPRGGVPAGVTIKPFN